MVTEIDIYYTANQVIKKCGDRYNPKEYSISKMRSLYDKGDIEGATIWANVGNAIDELVNKNLSGVLH